MKAPPFAYIKAKTLAEVFQLLETHGDGARLLAGGQSLLAALNLRLSSPEILIDITGIPGLAGIAVANGAVSIGALTTHAEIERSPEIARALPLLTAAAPHIAHVAIRNVGTFGGSIAMADPAAEWPACCLALGAAFVIANKGGNRKVKAREFFQALYTTSIGPAEVLTAIEIPLPARGLRHAFVELTRRRGDYAIVGVAATAMNTQGALSNVQLAYLGVDQTPVLANAAMAAVEGKRLSPTVIEAAAQALAFDLDPGGDCYSTPATKLHLARVITGRALAALNA
jgi:aerobic carbon-monoxide dehydrogenase medium subunit